MLTTVKVVSQLSGRPFIRQASCLPPFAQLEVRLSAPDISPSPTSASAPLLASSSPASLHTLRITPAHAFPPIGPDWAHVTLRGARLSLPAKFGILALRQTFRRVFHPANLVGPEWHRDEASAFDAREAR